MIPSDHSHESCHGGAVVDSQAEPTPRRRDGRRARTRARLLQVTLELLRREGVGGVTVSAIAKGVGVHHSLFYQHFKNVDACLAAAAEQVIEALAPIDREMRRDLTRRAVSDRRKLARFFAGTLQRWLEHRPLLELLIAHRLDNNPIGELMRPALAAFREEIAGELWDLAARAGVDGKHMGLVRTLADLHVANWLWALECMLEGRQADREAFAVTLADIYVSTNVTFFGRMRLRSYEEIVEATFSEQERTRLSEERAALREYVAERSDAELIEEAGSADQLVDRLLEAQVSTFLPEAAGTHAATVHYRIAVPDGEVRRRVRVQDGRIRVDAMCDAGEPRTTFVMPLRVLLETVSGARQHNQAYKAGDLEVEGDLFFAVELTDWFFEA